MRKRITLKEKPSFLDYLKKASASGGKPPRPPFYNINVFTFGLTCQSKLVLLTDMANNFYYCGQLSLKLLIFRLIITYFGTLRMRQIAPFY